MEEPYLSINWTLIFLHYAPSFVVFTQHINLFCETKYLRTEKKDFCFKRENLHHIHTRNLLLKFHFTTSIYLFMYFRGKSTFALIFALILNENFLLRLQMLFWKGKHQENKSISTKKTLIKSFSAVFSIEGRWEKSAFDMHNYY